MLRYRMTIRVDTPGGVKEGYGVLETGFNPGSSLEYSASSWTFGEAPMVDLGNGKVLFALLTEPHGVNPMREVLFRWLEFSKLAPPVSGEGGIDRLENAIALKPAGLLLPKYYPMLVTFENIDDPKSVRQVYPNRIENTFGSGFSLQDIAIQALDAEVPLTGGIEKKLKWLSLDRESGLDNDYVSGTASTLSLAQQLPFSAFGRRARANADT